MSDVISSLWKGPGADMTQLLERRLGMDTDHQNRAEAMRRDGHIG